MYVVKVHMFPTHYFYEPILLYGNGVLGSAKGHGMHECY